ncbi:MAG: ABC transporter substrate-binding protein [Azospirillum sp.]|nr:ABC transporter substrate-binding protein [Azospirillum sp.]
MKQSLTLCAALMGALMTGGMGAARAEEPAIPVGHLATNSGETSSVAQAYAQGIVDSLDHINAQGGIKGRKIAYETVDYGYDALKAVATYADWLKRLKPVAVFGWGTADTEALVQFVARDQIVFMSGSSSGHLTDPTGLAHPGDTAAPYNFFYGPSYSDGCRGLVQWAAEDWRRTRGANTSTFLQDLSKPKFVHMGDNHPYPNSPMAACADYARDLGFQVLPPIRYSLKPGNYEPHCRELKASGAEYVFLANTTESNVALVKACAAAGVTAQLMTNIYGWDESAIEAAKEDGNGMVWVVSAAPWTSAAPGMALVREVSKASDSRGNTVRPAHYIRGVCSAFLMRDAMTAATAMTGGVTGANIKAALEQMKGQVPAGLEGVCQPSTWTSRDHRGSTKITLYQSHYSNGQGGASEIYATNLPLRPDWLGW